MSSAEFAELHGISGIVVSERASLLMSARKRDLLMFIQALSLREGGLKRLARELVEMFPKRISKDDFEQAFQLRQQSNFDSHAYGRRRQSIVEFLVDLCINPRMEFAAPGDDMDVSEFESERATDRYPEISGCDFDTARLDYFDDIVGALFEYQSRYEAAAKEKFQLTTIGRKIWETLDYALKTGGMAVLDGLEGRGKTQAVKAWVECHLGRARFASLVGTTNKTTAFRELGKPLGIPTSYSRTAAQLQSPIEDILRRSKLMLVVDEAHFLFNQSRRMNSRPELLDWIDTAICNHGIGIALVTTPQFLVCMTRAADQVEWNYRQFRRRVGRWVKLDPQNTEADIRAVAKAVFPKANAGMISEIVSYALLSKLDLSAIGNIAKEVRLMLGSDDLAAAKLEHIQRAIDDFLIPGDQAFLEDMASARSAIKKGRPVTIRQSLESPLSEPEPAAQGSPRQIESEDSPQLHSRLLAPVPGTRNRVGKAASLIEA